MTEFTEAVWAAYLAPPEDVEPDAAAAWFQQGAGKKAAERKRIGSARVGQPRVVSPPDGSEAEFYVETFRSSPAVLLDTKSMQAVLRFFEPARD